MWDYAPEAITHPRRLWWFGKTLTIPDLTVPNLVQPGEQPPTFFGAYDEWMQTPPPTWDDVAWLVEIRGGPLILKGIGRVDDAQAAAAAGVSAISVSNHGGNNLDSTPASIRALPAVVDAVGDKVEIVLDGGVRRGSDVVKAVALGARAVMIGRAYPWAPTATRAWRTCSTSCAAESIPPCWGSDIRPSMTCPRGIWSFRRVSSGRWASDRKIKLNVGSPVCPMW